MPIGVEGLSTVVQRVDAVQTAQALQQQADRSHQLAAGVQTQESRHALDNRVEDRPAVELEGFWSEERRNEPYPEGEEEPRQEAEAPAKPTPTPDGRGSVLDVQA